MATFKRKSKDMSNNMDVIKEGFVKSRVEIYDKVKLNNDSEKGHDSKRASIASNISTDTTNTLETLIEENTSKRTSIASNISTDTTNTLETLIEEDSSKKLSSINELLQDMSKSMDILTEHVKDKHSTMKKIGKQDNETLEQSIKEEFKEILSPKKSSEEPALEDTVSTQNIMDEDEYEIEDYAKLEDAPKLKIANKFEQYLGSKDSQDKYLNLDELRSKYIDKESELFARYEATKDTMSGKERLELEGQLDETRDILSKLTPLQVVDNYNDDWDDIAPSVSNYMSKEQFEVLRDPIYINTQTGEKINLSEIDAKKMEETRKLEVARLVEGATELTTEKLHIRNYEDKDQIIKLANRLEETIKSNITKEENIITEAIEQELKNAYNEGISQGNIDEALDHALDNIRVHMEVKGVKINTSLGRNPQSIKFSNGNGVTLVNTKVDKIQLNNEKDKILFDNRAKLLSAVERAHQNEQKLRMCIKNYGIILNTDVKHREGVYKELFNGNNFSDSIKKEAINIVIKKQLEKNNNTQPKKDNNIPKETVKKNSIWRRLGIMLGSMLGIIKKNDNNIKINLVSDILDNATDLKKVQDLKNMSKVVNLLNKHYLKDNSKDMKNITVVHKGQSLDNEEVYKIQLINKNGGKTILEAKTKDGQIHFKESEIQEEFKNVRLIKRYNLSDSANIRKDLIRISNSLEVISAKMEISKDKTEISELKAVQNELFKDGRFDDMSSKKIIDTGINLKRDMMNNIDNYEALLLKGYEKLITTDPKLTLDEVTKKSKLVLKENYPREMEGQKRNFVSITNRYTKSQKYPEIMQVSEEREKQRRSSMNPPNKDNKSIEP